MISSGKPKKLLNKSFLSFVPTLIQKITPFYKFKISGDSMQPVLQNGNIVLVNRLTYLFKKPRVHDVVAIYDPRDHKILIKRITRIEENHYFVEGDNKKASTDSRKFGMLEKKDILGKVIS